MNAKILIASLGFLPVAVQAQAVANLFDDYTETGAVAGTTTFTENNWTFTDGNGAALTFDTDLGGTAIGGTPSGYSGTDVIFGLPSLGTFPFVSDEGVFDGNTPGANQLTFHPGDDADGDGLLTITWTAPQAYSNLSLEYNFNLPAGGEVDINIGGTAGFSLVNAVVNNSNPIAGTLNVSNVSLGETLVFTMGNGAGDDSGADQTFGNLIIVPEPSSLALLAGALGLLGYAMVRRR